MPEENLIHEEGLMALRLIELVLPAPNEDNVREIVKNHEVADLWVHPLAEEKMIARILTTAEDSEGLMDDLDKRFSHMPGFRLFVLPVQASLPRTDQKQEEKEKREPQEKEEKRKKYKRISREELYSGLRDNATLSSIYLATVSLSVVVAAIGILRSNVAVIIGAMVIAPLLGPNLSLSLATTLADLSLGRRALHTLASGLGLALVLSVIIGFFLEVDPSLDEIQSRTNVALDDIALAMASGSAGALFITIGFSTALVGVMVAVALLPPLVTLGLLLGSGDLGLAYDVGLLFLTNLICVNLAGVITFFAQGIRPGNWWEADKAKNLTRIALLIWALLLVALALLITLTEPAFK